MFSFLAVALVGKPSSIHAPFIPRCPIGSDVGLLSVKLKTKKQVLLMNQKNIFSVNRDISYLPVSNRGYIYVITITSVFIVE
jgi:hypothetical protein